MKASDILELSDLQTKVVKVKEWKRDLTVRELNLEDSLKLLDSAGDLEGDTVVLTAESIARVIVWGVINPDTSERVFSDDDIAALAQKNHSALMFLYKEIMSLSSESAVKN